VDGEACHCHFLKEPKLAYNFQHRFSPKAEAPKGAIYWMQWGKRNYRGESAVYQLPTVVHMLTKRAFVDVKIRHKPLALMASLLGELPRIKQQERLRNLSGCI
jgi:hypothetical protein